MLNIKFDIFIISISIEFIITIDFSSDKTYFSIVYEKKIAHKYMDMNHDNVNR